MKRGMPTVFGLSVGLPFTLYAWRLRTRAAQELLAVAGIAVGVALVFGVLVANTSIGGSAGSLVHQLIGSAQLQLVARSQQGIDQSVTTKVEALPGVQAASPLLREDVVIAGPKGSEAIQLIGATAHQLSLNAQATRDLGSSATGLISRGIGLPTSVADAIGAQANGTVILRADGRRQIEPISAVLGSQTIGAVAKSPIGITLMSNAQTLTGESGRVTNVLIETRPGAQKQVIGELRALAHGRANVTPADNELRLLSVAATPNQQSTTLFAAIAGMVGFLLALNAMLLTMPERRRLVAELRTYGYDPAQIVFLLMAQALMLGIVGSILGMGLGAWLSHTLFGGVPSYLSAAFAIGDAQDITATTIAIATACGVLAAILASLRPLLDLRAEAAHGHGHAAIRRGRADDPTRHCSGGGPDRGGTGCDRERRSAGRASPDDRRRRTARDRRGVPAAFRLSHGHLRVAPFERALQRRAADSHSGSWRPRPQGLWRLPR